MKIYEFLYCGCIYESSYATVSLHRTKLGAYKAMRKHRLDTFNEWYNSRIIYGKSSRFAYDFAQGWALGEQTLED